MLFIRRKTWDALLARVWELERQRTALQMEHDERMIDLGRMVNRLKTAVHRAEERAVQASAGANGASLGPTPLTPLDRALAARRGL